MAARDPLSETQIRTLLALVMAEGRTKAKPTPYRDGQNVSRDVAALFGISERAARNLLQAWVAGGFVAVADPARKTRRYMRWGMGIGCSSGWIRVDLARTSRFATDRILL